MSGSGSRSKNEFGGCASERDGGRSASAETEDSASPAGPTLSPHIPQNLFPRRLRYPQTRQTIVVGSSVSSRAVSSAACSASASAASRCTASSAAANASGPGLGRRISGCSPRYRFSNSEPANESDGKADGFLLSSSTNRITPPLEPF